MLSDILPDMLPAMLAAMFDFVVVSRLAYKVIHG
jgi:hypothetical protein